MLNDVYNSKILELAGNIAGLGRLEQPEAKAKAHSRLCGSTVAVELCVEAGTVSAFAQDVKACALGQASASVLGAHVVGATAQEVLAAQQALRAMLKENGPAPEGRFADLRYLEPVREYKARHASTMLAFDACVDALQQLGALPLAGETGEGAR
ncbi:iron-sulfur cluster assembly scaffold protein [Polycladidibacter hongkongensis]|uniref:iron-sulfur cluster assembly scaffold protein n=1 Tax=Polycladidibacter hongkongensis TaxID=1647556 RepID=UPI00083172EA|nr:iron-sulfur cluster assembly scaffold protein [Pseudovibrio hongkongensis]